MELYREGRLYNGRKGNGAVLTVELHGDDADALIAGRTIGSRLVRSCRVAGWALEDKIQVRFERNPQLQRTELAADLRLDPGGDLYFTINDNLALQEIKPIGQIDFDDLEQFVEYGGERLAAVGVEVISFWGLQMFCRKLNESR